MAANSTPPGDIPATHPSAEPFRLSPRAFLAAHFPDNTTIKTPSSLSQTPTVLGTGAIVFDRPLPAPAISRPASSGPRVLLVQRAPHDSMPLKWEVPGGGCDDEDFSVLAACARELWEETGLRATGAGPLVPCPRYPDGEDEAGTDHGAEVDGRAGELGGQFFRSRSGKLVCKFQFVMQVDMGGEEEGEKVMVKLDPNEHFAYTWATEDEVRRKEVNIDSNPEGIVRADGQEADGAVLEFASREQWDIVLEAFKLWRTE